MEIDIERLVCDAHRTATQLDRFAVFTGHQLVVLKSFRWLVRCRPDRFLERRRARLNPASKTFAKHADWAEFHCPREFIPAPRAGALWLCAHDPPNRLFSRNLSRRQRHALSSDAKPTSTARSFSLTAKHPFCPSMLHGPILRNRSMLFQPKGSAVSSPFFSRLSR